MSRTFPRPCTAMSGSNVSVTTFFGEGDGDIVAIHRNSGKRGTSLQTIVDGSKSKNVTSGARAVLLVWVSPLWLSLCYPVIDRSPPLHLVVTSSHAIRSSDGLTTSGDTTIYLP